MNEIIETQKIYYDYVTKIQKGCQVISDSLREGKLNVAIESIIDFSEGLRWLLSVEDSMMNNQYKIESSINDASKYLNEINNALEQQDFVLVADLFEYEIKSIFKDTEKWVFIKITN